MLVKKFIPVFFSVLSQALHLLFSVGECCRFEPSCSRYATEAYLRFDVFRATRLTLSRWFRCRPGQPYGEDPVPEILRSI